MLNKLQEWVKPAFLCETQGFYSLISKQEGGGEEPELHHHQRGPLPCPPTLCLEPTVSIRDHRRQRAAPVRSEAVTEHRGMLTTQSALLCFLSTSLVISGDISISPHSNPHPARQPGLRLYKPQRSPFHQPRWQMALGNPVPYRLLSYKQYYGHPRILNRL